MTLTLSETLLVGVYYAVLVALTVFAAHRLHLLRLVRRPEPDKATVRPADHWPSVCVQLPLYNEPRVVERLVRAVARLSYPGELSVQVLDDSDDETTAIARRVIDSLETDFSIQLIRRSERSGFKAGALAHGLSQTDAEVVAVFDADFVPPTDFLLTTVRHFDDAEIGMVQCRWTHLNRDESLLTRVQALYLDAHFAVETPARYRAGFFFNFNGTAGLWRREAITDAGGWSAETVTEDLDLSYRSQLAGWRFCYLESVTVPAELPPTLESFHGQQFRWAKGSIQTARRRLPSIWLSSAPLGARIEATFHLTNNFAYLLTLTLALLLGPAAAIRYSMGLGPMLLIDLLLFSICTGSLVAFYRAGQRRTGQPPPRLRELLATIPLGVGLSIINTRAAIEGLFTSAGTFNRTPKKGQSSGAILEKPPRRPVGETIVAAWLLSTLILFASTRVWLAIPFMVLFLAGFGSTAVISTIELARWFRSRRVRDFS